jgi:hypothetical protein
MMNDTMLALSTAIAPLAAVEGLTRQRGGMVRGVWWAEISGRHADGAWYEMRFHEMQDGTLKAGMLVYHPLSRGGRTEEIGTTQHDTDDKVDRVIADVLLWLARIHRNHANV